MQLIDTHAHLDFEYEANETVKDIIQRAKAQGVHKIITIASSAASNKNILSLSSDNDNVYHSICLHPHDANDFTPSLELSIK